MTTILKANRSFAALCLAAILSLFTVMANAATVSESMKQIAGAYGAAMKAEDLEGFSQAIEKLNQVIHEAGLIKFSANPTEQAQYTEGIASLKKGLEKVNVAVVQKDLALAKQTMAPLIEDRNKYHKLLRK